MTFQSKYQLAEHIPPTKIAPPQMPPSRTLINSRSVAQTAFSPARSATTDAFANWMRTLRNTGSVLYAATVTYCDNSSMLFTVNSAQRRGARFYNYLLTRLFDRRHYNAPEYRPFQPLMVLFLDAPGSKRKNSKPQRSNSNTAPYHHHGFLAITPTLIPSFKQLVNALDAGIRDSSLLDGIQSVRIELLDLNISKWTRYSSAYDQGEFLVFPKSSKEFRERTIPSITTTIQ